MARNGSGVMSLGGQFAIPGGIPNALTIDGYIDDICNELTDSLSRSGKGGMLADLAMGTHKITGLVAGVASTDGVNVSQLQSNTGNAATSVGGTADAMTAGFTPALTAYTNRQIYRVVSPGANTITNPVINMDGLGNKTIKKLNGVALSVGDIAGSGHALLLYYDGTNMLLINPAIPTTGPTVGKQKLWVPASSMITRSTNGAALGTIELATNKQIIRTWDFDPTTQEFVQFFIAMPKAWDEGTITFCPVWSHAATTVNFGVVWALEAVAMADNTAMDAAWGTAQQIADTGGTTNNYYRGAESPAITVGGGPAANAGVFFQVKRVPADGSDTMAIDARLHGIELYYTIDANTEA